MSSSKRDADGVVKNGGRGIVIDLTKEATTGPAGTVIDLSTESQPAEKPQQISSEQTCGICLESVSEQGILDACDHAFCFECIFKWSKTANTCPMCKRSFATLTPKQLANSKPSKKKRRAIYRIKEKKQQYEYTPEELAALADAQEEESDEVGPDEYVADGWLVLDDEDLWSTDSSDFEPHGDPHRDEIDNLLFEARLVSHPDSDSDESEFLEDLLFQLSPARPPARAAAPTPAPAAGTQARRQNGVRGRRGRAGRQRTSHANGAGRLIPADVLATLRRPRRFGIRR